MVIDPQKEPPVKEEEHVLHMWQPLHFSVQKGYNYRRAGLFGTISYCLVRLAAFLILVVLDPLVFGVRIKGRKHLTALRGSGAVTVCNHVHPMDCTALDLAFVPKRTYYLTLETNFRIPIVRHLIRLLGGVPLPHDLHCMREMLSEMEKALHQGCLVQVYPEGVLHPYYRGLRGFKDGAFRLAVSAKVPVLPAVVTFHPPRGLTRLFRKKPCLHLTLLAPVYPIEGAPKRAEMERMKLECQAAMGAEIERLELQAGRST